MTGRSDQGSDQAHEPRKHARWPSCVIDLSDSNQEISLLAQPNDGQEEHEVS
jgi:hypothetical protein